MDNSPSSRSSHARLLSIDALRGLVMVIMLVDHVRDTFYLHRQVPDPLVITETPLDLFASRLLAHICAPVFIFLTGLSAWFYGNGHSAQQGDGRAAASAFLFKRGLFLVLLEVTIINFVWMFELPPTRVFLQVIWAIGCSMIALSALLWLPRAALLAVAVLLMAGHNLLDGIHFQPDDALYIPWAVLHDRVWIQVTDTLRMRTSYPLLPWIGVLALGWWVGQTWFAATVHAAQRQRQLLHWGIGLLVFFALLRACNIYGDKPWVMDESALLTAMNFVNITKYPPSLLFLAFTLGCGALLLRWLECCSQNTRWFHGLVIFGAAPMFFYILHLCFLKAFYLIFRAIWGNNHGHYFGFDTVWQLWLGAVVLLPLLYPPVKAFAQFKARRRDLAWLKYL